MKRTRKGFTLVELLIVVAILGVLASMMTMSSSDSIDSAGANTILGGLNSLKTAAMQMYMEDSKAAALTEVKLDGSDTISLATNVKTLLAQYMGKDVSKIGIASGKDAKYGLVGNSTNWFVVYKMDKSDSVGVRKKLKAKAVTAELYGLATDEPAGSDDDDDVNNCGLVALATSNTEIDTVVDYYVALKVR